MGYCPTPGPGKDLLESEVQAIITFDRVCVCVLLCVKVPVHLPHFDLHVEGFTGLQVATHTHTPTHTQQDHITCVFSKSFILQQCMDECDNDRRIKLVFRALLGSLFNYCRKKFSSKTF